jgi:hemolysin activation/secretion protein
MDFLERTRIGFKRKPVHLAIAVMLFLQACISTGNAITEAKTQYASPEDTSTIFLVKEIKISGNTLVSTAELLENLPEVYAFSLQKDEVATEEYYDFRVLHEIILDPSHEREVSKKTIQGLTRYLLSVYQEKGYAGIYVYVPAKAVKGVAELEDRILPIEVLEGKVAKVTIDRYDFDRQEVEKEVLKSSMLKSWSPVKEGQVIKKKELDDFVRLLNLNPDRYISAVISKSYDPNKLDLTYDVYELNPWHWYAQIDNSGTEDRQWTPKIGLTNTNLLGFDDKFSVMYQAPWDKKIDDRYAVFGSYDFPILTPRLRLNIYGGYSQFNTPGGTGINFLGNGSFYGGILSYNLFQINSWFVDVTGSISQESSKVTPSLGLESNVGMDLWGTGLRIHHLDANSETSLAFNTTQSMGGSSKKEFDLARLNTNPYFTFYTVSAAHSQYLDPKKVNRLSGSFQWIIPDERLTPAKMTGFGGLYSVRGYEEYEIVADGGILASCQYEFDLVKYSDAIENLGVGLKKSSEKKLYLKKLAPLAFVDYGQAKIKDPVPGEDKTQDLCSVGTGVIIELGDTVSAGIYYGWALIDTAETDKGDGQLSLSFLVRW